MVFKRFSSKRQKNIASMSLRTDGSIYINYSSFDSTGIDINKVSNFQVLIDDEDGNKLVGLVFNDKNDGYKIIKEKYGIRLYVISVLKYFNFNRPSKLMEFPLSFENGILTIDLKHYFSKNI